MKKSTIKQEESASQSGMNTWQRETLKLMKKIQLPLTKENFQMITGETDPDQIPQRLK